MMTLIPYRLVIFLTAMSIEQTMTDKQILPDKSVH